MRWFRFAVLVLLASLLQTGLVGAMAILRADFKPDLLLILLVFFALRCNSTDAIIASFAIGFAADLSNPIAGRLMGPRIISFGLFGTLLSDLNSTISPRRVIYQAVTQLCLTLWEPPMSKVERLAEQAMDATQELLNSKNATVSIFWPNEESDDFDVIPARLNLYAMIEA